MKMKTVWVKTADSDTASRETCDCSVYALSVFAQISYDKAHALLKQYGRPDNDGVRGYQQRKLLEENFHAIEVQQWGDWRDRPTVAQFCKAFSNGRYYVRTRKHALAIVDGVPHDSSFRCRTKSRITTAWKRSVARAVPA